MRTTIDMTFEVEIVRPLAAVWEFVSDVERAPEWLEEFQVAHKLSDGPINVGSVVHYTVSPGDRGGTFEIVEWDPPHRVAWDGSPLRWGGGAARPRGSHALEQSGEERTLFTGRYRPELSGAQVLLRPYLKRWLRRRRLADVQTLKAALEAPGRS